MKFRYIGFRPTQYMNPSVLAEPGKVYELDMVPDDGNWERATERKTNKSANEEVN